MVKLISSVANVVAGFKRKSAIAMMALMAFVLSAIPAGASGTGNADLNDATQTLIEGVGDIKTNGLLIVGVVIALIVVIFGIMWLIGLAKRGVSKA